MIFPPKRRGHGDPEWSLGFWGGIGFLICTARRREEEKSTGHADGACHSATARSARTLALGVVSPAARRTVDRGQLLGCAASPVPCVLASLRSLQLPLPAHRVNRRLLEPDCCKLRLRPLYSRIRRERAEQRDDRALEPERDCSGLECGPTSRTVVLRKKKEEKEQDDRRAKRRDRREAAAEPCRCLQPSLSLTRPPPTLFSIRSHRVLLS